MTCVVLKCRYETTLHCLYRLPGLPKEIEKERKCEGTHGLYEEKLRDYLDPSGATQLQGLNPRSKNSVMMGYLLLMEVAKDSLWATLLASLCRSACSWIN